jgi:hypothetical protein
MTTGARGRTGGKARGGEGLRFGLMWPNTRSQSIMSKKVADESPDVLDPDVHRELAGVVEGPRLRLLRRLLRLQRRGQRPGRPRRTRLYGPVWASLVIAATHNIGVVTTLHARYLAAVVIARLEANLDVMSRGRWGWNVVPGAKAGETGPLSHTLHRPPGVCGRPGPSRRRRTALSPCRSSSTMS